MRGTAVLPRLGLLLALLPLVQCNDGGGGGRRSGVSIVAAFEGLTFTNPLFFAQAPGDDVRGFVATQGGQVHVFPIDGTADAATVFLDIDDRVTDAGGELGLLGLAFDPGFATNGYLYVNYNPNFDNSGSNPRRTRISRFHAEPDADSVDPATETVLLEFDQPYNNHNGGWLGFGPDDKLYIASGDGGSTGDPQNNAQNLDSLLGKILRINKDGSIPSDNPFVGVAGADEVWAYGLRNPWRASFDRVSGELWAGDVGQGLIEEIDLIGRGGNYGWRKYEGSSVYNDADPVPAGAIFPVYEYEQVGGRCSITGGYVYRGSAMPGHEGGYFYADFCSGEVWQLSPDGSGWVNHYIGTVAGNPTSFGEDNAGELYLTSFNGKVYKLVARTSSNNTDP